MYDHVTHRHILKDLQILIAVFQYALQMPDKQIVLQVSYLTMMVIITTIIITTMVMEIKTVMLKLYITNTLRIQKE
jgi:hypothetical protein